MVLFKEDEEKMKARDREEKLAKRTPLGRWIRRLFKLSLLMAFLLFVSVIMLSALGGDHPELKKGIETYLAQSTGMHAEIGEFERMSFFPDMKLDAGSIKLRRAEAGPADVSIETLKFSTGFFDLLFARRRFKTIEINNLAIAPGIAGKSDMVLDFAGLKDEGPDGGPALIIQGRYGKDKIALNAGMEKDISGHFLLPEKGDFDFSLGELHIHGTAGKAKGGAKIEIAVLEAPEKILSGDILVSKTFSKRRISADIALGGSRMETDIKTAGNRIEGDIQFPVFDPADTALLLKLNDMRKSLPFMKHSKEIDLYGMAADLHIEAASLKIGENDIGRLSFPLVLEDQELTIGPLGGRLNGGTLSGKIRLDARTLPAVLDIGVKLKNWDIGHYQRAAGGKESVRGTADLHIKAGSKGKTLDELTAGLNGDAVMIAGEGEFATAALNIWGGGLVNALIPSLEKDAMTKLNCIIADFKIENGIARPKPLFMDTEQLTLVGEGEIDLTKHTVNLKLEPKAKNPALLDVATAVKVSGPILQPSIGPETFSLFEKIGGLALGFVNPAWLAFSMTDLGLSENHPCHKFIGAPPEDRKAEAEPPRQEDRRMAGGKDEDRDEDEEEEPEAESELETAPAAGEAKNRKGSFNE